MTLSEPANSGETTHARVYVNDKRVDIQSKNPTVAEVVRKAGYDPEKTDAFRLRDAKDSKGERVDMDTVLKIEGRTESIYLRCVPRRSKEKEGEAPSILPSLTSTPEDEKGRGLTVKDLTPTPSTPTPLSPSPEPPGPPGLGG